MIEPLHLIRVCEVNDCEEEHVAQGLCRRHYTAWYEQTRRKPRPPQTRVCSEPDCDRPHWARGWCSTHYSRWYEKTERGAQRRKAAADTFAKRHPEKIRKWSRQRTARWRERNPSYAREAKLRKFGLTPERYQELFERQNGVCAICGHPPQPKRSLSIDHDHSCCPKYGSCGKCVRGLLCQPCNVSLGGFQDSPTLLAAAISYLEGGGAL